MNGATQIQLRTGLNCWQGRCFRYNRFVSVPGREPVPIPEDVEIIDGFVTEDGFARILAEARQAPRQRAAVTAAMWAAATRPQQGAVTPDRASDGGSPKAPSGSL